MELGRLEEATEDCRRAIALYPKHFAAYVVLGQAESRRGRRAEALAAFEGAVALKPRDRQGAALLEGEREADESPPQPAPVERGEVAVGLRTTSMP